MPPPDIEHEPPALAANPPGTPQPPYKILHDTVRADLESEVSDHLANGYKLAGGVAVRNDGNNDPVFYQAVAI